MPFLRTVLPPEVDGALEQWRPTARQKRSYLYHQGEFQHSYFDFVSLQHSDHDSVVRIFVGHSEIVKRLLIIYISLDYITRHNFLYTRSVILLQTHQPPTRGVGGRGGGGGVHTNTDYQNQVELVELEPSNFTPTLAVT